MAQMNSFSSDNPPPYSPMYDKPSTAATHSKWNPLYWPTWVKLTGLGVTTIIIIAIIVGAVEATKSSGSYPDYSYLNYTIADNYTGTSFFDNFNYFTGYDPSAGFVHYVPSATATSSEYNLTYAGPSSAVLRVDTTNTDASTGRYSVRITSKKQYSSGLFIFDILHSPYGCSTWPAIWLSDPSNWPTNGEIDVVEAVNHAVSGNQMTLHTTAGCTMKGVQRKESGTVTSTNCLNSTNDNAGCAVKGPVDTVGAALNAIGGGVYALEFRAAGIRVWFFARSSIPSDLVYGADASPDPGRWGEAMADFPSTDCDVGAHFRNQSIIADIDLCGTWAGATAVYGTQDGCPGTCEAFVAGNATAFETAYWEWKSFRVYGAE